MSTSRGCGWTCFLLSPQFSPIFSSDPDGLRWQERLSYLPLNERLSSAPPSCSIWWSRRASMIYLIHLFLVEFSRIAGLYLETSTIGQLWIQTRKSVDPSTPRIPSQPPLGHMTSPANHRSGAEVLRCHSNKPALSQPMGVVAYSELRRIPPFLKTAFTQSED